MHRTLTIKPAGWLATTLLFGVPALIFAFLFHWLGPDIWRQGTSWWGTFHFLLVLPLALMLVAALLGAAIDLRSVSWKALRQRLRLSAPDGVVWLWAAALSGFMYGGNWADLIAVAGSWFALWKAKTNKKWIFVATLIGVFVKRNAALLQPGLQSVRFFDPSAFYSEFFSHFGPHDFMGLPLRGAWWIPVYYAFVMLVCNIGGEELWARLCAAPTETRIRQDCVGYPWRFLVSLSPIHAADALGHGPDGNYRCRAFLCCTTYKKHVAWHRRPQLRQLALLVKFG